MLKIFLSGLFNRKLAPTAFRVALIVGTMLLLINHGNALIKGQMTRDRWLSAILTYCVPYMVNVHGQFVSASRK
ncbi:nitrate/nitrite transporter NrtS [Alkalinema sp. FACHB-956]|uniref:nitrate/nitrite transporter NrtS n=1 Tax=Alkalinema sp. FACHB-956 TaxID=2692768 RepID=UPI0016875613|nr:nitrate/nitrite transporter NrtS [Alkalinema sp. FACHB-956]MBD2329301.1 nitrate/nitrite transporter NrtS [Alkalinema sp. FACHB-956]